MFRAGPLLEVGVDKWDKKQLLNSTSSKCLRNHEIKGVTYLMTASKKFWPAFFTLLVAVEMKRKDRKRQRILELRGEERNRKRRKERNRQRLEFRGQTQPDSTSSKTKLRLITLWTTKRVDKPSETGLRNTKDPERKRING
jgi:hypothetical protein